MNVRIVVADERQANFFHTTGAQAPIAACGTLANEAAGLKDRDLESDRPGRAFSSVGSARSALDGERSSERHEIEQFAREVARAVDAARVRHEFDRLVVIAGPRMLGLIRDALPDTCRSAVRAEIPKVLTQLDMAAIQAALPREVFLH